MLAQSFERIHRSNLVGMGILPLEFVAGGSAETLGLTGTETFDITGIAGRIVPKQEAALQPLRIWPDQVKGKNAMGCLSPADASLYGPDGCPLKLCTIPEGTMTLPPL